MILSISQYIEALMSSDGRFRSLERLQAVHDATDFPVFAMPGHGLVDFEVEAGNVRYTLRCPLRRDADALSRLRILGSRERGLGGRFITEWNLLESEVTLFDETGNSFEVDILARPTPVGTPLVDFLDRASARADRDAIAAVARSFDELIRWADENDLKGISLKRLVVSSEGNVSLTGFSATDERERIRRMLDAENGADITAGITLTANEDTEENAHSYEFKGEGDIKCVKDRGGWRYVDTLGRPVIETLWLSASPFREGRAEVETATGKGLIDTLGRKVLEPIYEELVWDEYWSVVMVMFEGGWSILDRDGVLLCAETFDWLGECSEGMVLALRDGKCGFVDISSGKVSIPCIYEEASSFKEGYAMVTLDGKEFLIDDLGTQLTAA